MCNIYFTIEPEWKIKNIFVNLKKFYILNIDHILSEFELDLSKQYNVYYLNNYIINILGAKLNNKKLLGIIYINSHLNEKVFDNIYNFISNKEKINKFIIIDDGQFPKMTKLYNRFDEVLFFDRFKKIKILEN